MANSTSQPEVIDVSESDVDITTTTDIVIARQNGRRLAANHAFSKSQQTRFATAISELTRNVLTYAVKGKCLFSVTYSHQKTIITAKIIDYGPGIKSIEQALKDGFSSGQGMGLGLPGAKRLVDSFTIASKPGFTVVEVSVSQQSTVRRS